MHACVHTHSNAKLSQCSPNQPPPPQTIPFITKIPSPVADDLYPWDCVHFFPVFGPGGGKPPCFGLCACLLVWCDRCGVCISSLLNCFEKQVDICMYVCIHMYAVKDCSPWFFYTRTHMNQSGFFFRDFEKERSRVAYVMLHFYSTGYYFKRG